MPYLLRILVLVKMVPDVSQLHFDAGKMTLVREGVKNIVNPFDRRAVEAAVVLREKMGGEVVVVSMGPPSAVEILRATLAAGADRAVLLSDIVFAGSDTLATSTALSMAAKRLGFDLVLGGVGSIDAETSQVMPEVAQLLGASLVTNARRIDVTGNSLTVERDFEEGTETFEVGFPAVISVGEKINKPRSPTDEAKAISLQKPLEAWSASDLSPDFSHFGSAGSPTYVKSIFDASFQRNPVVFDGRENLPSASAKCLAELDRRSKESPPEATDMSRDTEAKPVWVVTLPGDEEARTACEMLGKVRTLGLRAVAVVTPDSVADDMAALAGLAGAEELIMWRGGTGPLSSLACAALLQQGIEAARPFAVLIPSTVKGREVAGRLAAAMRLGLTGDVTDLTLHRRGELIQVKPAFGGSVMAEVISKTSPRLATIRPGVFPLRSYPGAAPVTTIMDAKPLPEEPVKLALRTITVDPNAGDLDRAKAILCGGFGVGSKEGFDRLALCSTRIGAALAATRKAVDSGWAPPQVQVGLTGRSVHPSLIIEAGVSGSVNHLIGLRRARLVLSINSDPEAASLKACDVGLVAELFPALDALEEGLGRLIAYLQASP
jgi:electron transfer flavoprotein alpha subunit